MYEKIIKNPITRTAFLPTLLLLAGLVLSAIAAHFEFRQLDKSSEAEFERLSTRTEVEINARMEKTVHVLRSVRGLYAAVERSVSRDEFRRFVLSRDIENEFPGVLGFGFVQRVALADLPAFVAAQRADGAPDFSVQRLTDKSNTDLFVVKFIEPAANNATVLGTDLGSEAIRRSAIQLAINTGAPSITGVLELTHGPNKGNGLLLYVPVYKNDVPIDVPKERRAALVGVVYARIQIAKMLDGLTAAQTGMLDFEITDAPINATGGTLIFDTDSSVGLTLPGAKPNPTPRFSMRRPLQLPGRNVTITFNSTPTFEATMNVAFPWLIFASGSLISILLALVLRQQAGGRLRAENLANLMTHDLQIAVRENEALLSTLNLHTIVSIASSSGRILEVNDAFCAACGYSRVELVGQSYRVVHTETQSTEFWHDMWARISRGMPWRGHICNRRKDGELFWLDTLIAPFVGADGVIEKFVSISTDITASKKAEQALVESTHAAQAASLTKSQFLANMSHEIRTPMNAILGMLTLLGKTELTERQADYAHKSESAARTLMKLLNEILDYSKIEAGKMELDPQPFAMDQLLRDVSAIMSIQVGDKPVELRFDMDPAVPRQLIGDAMRLQQVLLNLGTNAIKFSERGEVLLATRLVQRSVDAATLLFSVQDSGIGIAVENQSRIFKGFTQAESSTTRRFGGTGLGLAISSQFVSLMGGALELQSELGKGSRFYFTISLPLTEDREVLDAHAGTDHRLQGMRLLLVEDNLNNQQVARELLEDEGALVQIANNGQEAIDAIVTARQSFDVVLMDWQMPVMDGFAAARHIRHELRLLTLPIVAMTANAMASDREACLAVGMNDHVGKPFDLNELVRVLRKQVRWGDASSVNIASDRLSPDVTGAATQAGLDLKAALHRMGGKQSVYRGVLQTFVNDVSAMEDQLRAVHVADQTPDAVDNTRRLLHTLKGLAATLGATALASAAAAAESDLIADPSAERAHSAGLQACAAIDRAIPGLQAMLKVLHQEAQTSLANQADDHGAQSLDVPGLLQVLASMSRLLRAQDMEAMMAMADLQQQFGFLMGQELEPLEHAMGNLDFENALQICEQLQRRYSATHGLSLSQ